jgi:hypothetical protein
MKLAMFLFAALGSTAFAQLPVDQDATLRPSLCESSDVLGSQCHTLALHGAPVRIAGIWKLSLVDVKDSRCPLDVDCVWEGMVTATFRLHAYPAVGTSEDIVLSLDPRHPAGKVWMDKRKRLKIELEAVTPLKIGRPPMPTRYYAHIRVSTIPFLGSPPVHCPDIEKPAVCIYEDVQVSGSNRCLALDELKRTLAQQGVPYDSEGIQCHDPGL